MKKALAFLFLLCAGLLWAQTFNINEPQGIRYAVGFTSASCGSGEFAGQVCVLVLDSTDPAAYLWNQNDDTWEMIAGDTLTLDGPLTVTGAATVSGAATVTGAATFSSTASFAGATTLSAGVGEVFYDDFCNVSVIQSDGTVESGTDAELNHIYTNASNGYYIQRIEQTATLGQAEQSTAGNCGLDVSGDITANEGHEIVFAPNPLMGIHRVDSATDEFFVTFSITITDISAFDGDFAFGVRLPEAQQNPPQHDGLNTYFIATLSDNAGDLDFEADVDGGGAVNDDSGVTWADGETKVVRFEVDGDGYTAYVDGTAITLTNSNATGANDFTDGDMLVPFYYHTQGAEGAATGVVINYISWGSGAL